MSILISESRFYIPYFLDRFYTRKIKTNIPEEKLTKNMPVFHTRAGFHWF